MARRLHMAAVALEGALLAALAAAPLLAQWLGQPFWLDVATRLTILAAAAVALNILLGLGGLISFGHAAFLGIGAYAVAIPAWHALYGGAPWLASSSGVFHFALAAAAGGLFALVTGFLALRTRGVHFIMITMAFGQMVFFLLQALETYGGDDGLTLDMRSQLPFISLDDAASMHWLAFAFLALCLVLFWRLAQAPFGLALAGARAEEGRMRALGYDVGRIRLAAYVLAGVLASVAGALMADFSAYVSPSMAEWTRSGELMFMVILGGAGRVMGPVAGAAAFVLLEEVLSSLTTYWHLPFGLLLMAAALWQAGALPPWHGKSGSGRSGEGGGNV